MAFYRFPMSADRTTDGPGPLAGKRRKVDTISLLACPFRSIPADWGLQRPKIGLNDPENPRYGSSAGSVRPFSVDLGRGG